MESNNQTSETLKKEIIGHLGSPAELEALYRKNKAIFPGVFNALYPNIKENPIAQIWNERLNFKQDDLILANKNELLFVLIATFIAGMLAKIPDFTGIAPDYFFPRNIGFIVLPMLTVFFLWRQKLSASKYLFPLLLIGLSAVYINMLPTNPKSDTLLLACFHLPLLLWSVLGFSFLGNEAKNNQKRIDYLRFNGNLVVMCALLALSGALFTGMTFGLFNLIGINIEVFYAKYFVVFAAPAIPILATYLVQNNPTLVNRISPVIARIFTPLAFVMLLFFLGAMGLTAKNPYNDREFLMIFNALLIAVMALIVFSVTEATKTSAGKFNLLILFGLSALTIIANAIALSAIALRIAEFGITPNRLAVLGSNVLIFLNLLLVAYRFFLVLRNKKDIASVENTIAVYLPIYALWTAMVTFLFPLIFSFK